MSIITIGIDLAKNIFAVHGVNENGHAELVKTQGCARPAIAADRQPAPVPDRLARLLRRARDLVARRGYWRAVVAIAAKNARVSWAVLKYGEDFRLNSSVA